MILPLLAENKYLFISKLLNFNGLVTNTELMIACSEVNNLYQSYPNNTRDVYLYIYSVSAYMG